MGIALDIAAHAGLLGWSVQLFECVGWAKTAGRHIQNLYTKIGASNRVAATRWAAEHRLLDSS